MENHINNHIPHFNIDIKEDDIENGALEILRHIRPTWKEDSINFKLLTDGITNKLISCKPKEADDEETVLVRVYGKKTDLIIDRKAETRNILLLNKFGLAPNLYTTFSNGIAYKYIPGCTLTSESVTDPNIYKLVAKQLALLHKVKSNDDSSKPCIWDKFRNFLDLVPEVFSDPDKNKRYLDSAYPIAKIKQESLQLKNILETLDSPIVFAHNDLLLGNVIFNKHQNKVTFIDYEYAALNYQAYDIANHFAEFVGLGEIDYAMYPSKEYQINWFREYLSEFYNRAPTCDELEKMYIHVNKFVLLTHLFWGVWSLVQAEHSSIGFDYIGYAAIRFNEYFNKKEQFLSLQLPS